MSIVSNCPFPKDRIFIFSFVFWTSYLLFGPGCQWGSPCTNRYYFTRPKNTDARWRRSTSGWNNTNPLYWWSKPATMRWDSFLNIPLASKVSHIYNMFYNCLKKIWTKYYYYFIISQPPKYPYVTSIENDSPSEPSGLE